MAFRTLEHLILMGFNAGNEPDLVRHKMLREVADEVADDAPPGSPAHSKYAWKGGFSTGQEPTCRVPNSPQTQFNCARPQITDTIR